MTKSMQMAIESLHLDKLYVVYPGKDSYKLDNIVKVINLDAVRSMRI